MEECMEYIDNFEGEAERRILQRLHALLTSLPGVSAKLRFKVPFYDRNRWLCYFNPLKKGGIELGFCQANLLSNEQGLLDFRDRTQVAGVSYFSVNDIREDVLLEILQEALLVDDELGKPKRKKLT